MFKSAEELREHIGREAYDEMKETFGGQRIYINRKTKWFDNPYFKIPKSERNAMLLADYRSGMRPKRISDKYGLQISYVRKLLYKLKKEQARAE